MERYNFLSENLHNKVEGDTERIEPLETEQGICHVENEPTRKWVDRGVENVAVEKINTSDSIVKTSKNFEKVSFEEMKRGTEVMNSFVRPNVERGWTAEEFRAYDQAYGLDYQHSTLKIYDAYYGGSSISLCKIGDNYTVADGGYHRLFVAKEIGLETVPARVYELT